jgi:glucose dehydrogenase
MLSLFLLLPYGYRQALAEETPVNHWPMFRQNESGTGESNLTLKTESILEQWRFQTGSSISCSPVIHQNTTYVLSDNRKLYALETESGQKRWESEEFIN